MKKSNQKGFSNLENKAVIMARVSTQEQAQEGYSIEAQVHNAKQYCQSKGFAVIGEPFKIIESSSNNTRPQFYEMIDFINKQQGTIHLVVQAADRLHRDFEAFAVINEMKDRGKIIIHFTRENAIYDKDSDDIKYHLDAVLGKYETKKLGRRVKTVLQRNLEEGRIIRCAPIGYLNVRDEDNKVNVILDKDRAYFIKKMFEMYSLGKTSLGDLLKFAEENRLTFPRSTKIIGRTSIPAMLKQPFYYGYQKCNGTLYKHRYEPLITKELFDECQKVTETRSTANNRPQAIQTAKSGKQFVFQNLVTCATTGRVVSSDRKVGRYNNENTYLISWNPEDTTKRVYTKESVLLNEVSNILQSIQIPDVMLTEITEYLKSSHKTEKEQHRNTIERLDRDISKKQERINELLEMRMDRCITSEKYVEMKRKVEEEIVELRDLRYNHEQHDKHFKDTVITAFELASKAHQIFQDSKTDEKRELLNFMFSNLQLEGSKLGYTLRKPFDLMVNLGSCTDWLPSFNTFRNREDEILPTMNRPMMEGVRLCLAV